MWTTLLLALLLPVSGTLERTGGEVTPLQAGQSSQETVLRVGSAGRSTGEGGPVRYLEAEVGGGIGEIRVYYWPGGGGIARRLVEGAALQPPLPALPAGVLGGGTAVSVYLAPDPARFDSLAGGRAPEWSAGLAIPSANRIILPGFISDRAEPYRLDRILRHELAHLALHQYLAPARPPRWFDEGYAQWAAQEWGWDGAWRLWVAFSLNLAPPLDSISLDWPADDAPARLAYLLAASAIGYLIEEGAGEDGMRIFLERWREGGELEPALRQTYGLTIAQFEHVWLKRVEKRYGWGLILTHTMIFWAPLAGLVVILTVRRRRRYHEQLEELRASETDDLPEYWILDESGTEPVHPGMIGEEEVSEE